jgi:hypothetical protein
MKQRIAPLHLALTATCFLILSSGCAREETPPPAPPSPAVAETPPPGPPVSAESLTLLDLKFDKNEAGKQILRGNVANSSPQTITYATASFTLLDANGREIGTATAGVDNLGPQFSWNFRVEIPQESVATAKFTGFTAK